MVNYLEKYHISMYILNGEKINFLTKPLSPKATSSQLPPSHLEKNLTEKL